MIVPDSNMLTVTTLLIVTLILQPILVFMSKVDGKFQFSPISVNFLTEVAKVIFAIIMLIIQVSLCSVTLLSGACTLILVHCVQPAVKYQCFSFFCLWGLGKCCKKLFIFSRPVGHQLIMSVGFNIAFVVSSHFP